jgi:glyoxylase-like metal-dependent hydrolase (beta-lactamase superfamily II)
MTDDVFRFDLGKFKCMIVSDGKLGPPPDSPYAPKSLTGVNGERLDLVSLFLDTGEHKILIDTGFGKENGMEPDAGKLVENLENAGVKTNDIDLILHTHAHIDHVTGTFSPKGKPIYPNARYILAKAEWEFINAKPLAGEDPAAFACARNRYVKMPEKIDAVENNTEIVPGIKLIVAPGHTPGSSMFKIASGNKQILFLGDLIHSLIELQYPKAFINFDVEPDRALKTRDQVFAKTAKSGTVLLIPHFPFPGLGRLVKKGKLFSWQPLNPEVLSS